MTKRAQRLFGALIIVAFAACSGDSMTGPGGNGPPSVAGDWTYAATNMVGNLSGFSIVCSFSNVPMSITQSGSTFSGRTTGGDFVCSSAGITDGGIFGDRIVVNGELSGGDVEFDFDGPDWHHTGTITGSSMSGTAIAILEISSGSVVLRGNWSAAR